MEEIGYDKLVEGIEPAIQMMISAFMKFWTFMMSDYRLKSFMAFVIMFIMYQLITKYGPKVMDFLGWSNKGGKK